MSSFIQGFEKGMKSFGKDISAIVNSVLLSFVYLVGVGLTSICAKIFSKHFLDSKLKQDEKSYWIDLNLTKKPRKTYYRQF
ncbi:hypothetical protein CMI37_26505 [Candidatus Pacearchaeota archaeon]|nr:hypothetical protein [Candidatus Pacearchaeota archaeon]|tara:strand:+ start:7293 stop:7535 length:243 start_codon:yes stop_codon:yes gene_type:complete